jgi:multiple antibiotic resistance protein
MNIITIDIILQHLYLSFLPLLISINVLSVIPIYLLFIKNTNAQQEKNIINKTIITMLIIGIGFLFIGKMIFLIMGIKISDFMIAGGALLFIISINTLIKHSDNHIETLDKESLAITPLAIPLLLGPATFASLLIVNNMYGYIITIIAFILNLIIVYIVLYKAKNILKYLGENGANAAGKISALLLSAYAVMMIRVGVTDTIMHIIKHLN